MDQGGGCVVESHRALSLRSDFDMYCYDSSMLLQRDTAHSFGCRDNAAYLYSLETFFLLIVCNDYLRNNLLLSMRHGIKLHKYKSLVMQPIIELLQKD